jgi:hypothetical protein
MGADVQRMTEEARAALPMRRLLEQHGHGPKESGESWKKFRCPFCTHRAATLFEPTGGERNVELFKCFHKPCASENTARNEAQMVGFFAGVNDREGWKLWCKEAGVLKEERLASSVLPGSKRRKTADPLATVTPSSPESSMTEAEIEQAKGLILGEGRASVSLLQRRLRWGYARAMRVMEELERRGVVGPALGAEPREILVDEEGAVKSGSSREPRVNNNPNNNTSDDFSERSDGPLEEEVPDGSVKPGEDYNEPYNKQVESNPESSQTLPSSASAAATGSSAEAPQVKRPGKGSTANAGIDLGAPETPQSQSSDETTPPGGTGPQEQSKASSPSGPSGPEGTAKNEGNSHEKIVSGVFEGRGSGPGSWWW